MAVNGRIHGHRVSHMKNNLKEMIRFIKKPAGVFWIVSHVKNNFKEIFRFIKKPAGIFWSNNIRKKKQQVFLGLKTEKNYFRKFIAISID